MTPLFLRSGAESKPDLILLFLYLYLFSNCLLWNISFPSYWYRCWVLPLSHFITTYVIFHFITRFMAYTLTLSFSFDHSCQYSSLLTSSIFIPYSSINLLEFLSNKIHFLPFSSIITKPGQHHSFPDSPLTEFMRRQAARLSVYYVFIISVSFLFNKHWYMVAEPLHSLSQDFYLSGDLILFWSDWIGGYLWISPGRSRRPYSKCIELLRQVRYPLTFHSGSLYLFGRS